MVTTNDEFDVLETAWIDLVYADEHAVLMPIYLPSAKKSLCFERDAQLGSTVHKRTKLGLHSLLGQAPFVEELRGKGYRQSLLALLMHRSLTLFHILIVRRQLRVQEFPFRAENAEGRFHGRNFSLSLDSLAMLLTDVLRYCVEHALKLVLPR